MTRTTVSAQELSQWLTRRLQQLESCHECEVGGIIALREPDSEGCNWSDSVVVRSHGVPHEYFTPKLREILIEARDKFNIASED